MNNNRNMQRQGVLTKLLKSLQDERENITAMLVGSGLSFDKFFATTSQALVKYPKLLDCEGKSLFNACMEAAHDGLRIDGKEAAIVEYEVTFDKGKPGERKVKLAEYTPMAYGLIQMILRGGEVIAMTADVVHANDDYQVYLGTRQEIHHVPYLEGERGPIIAAYSIATMKNGAVTFELVDRADLAAIRQCARTKNVWDSWPGEMSKKSAVRRHEKRLPRGERDIVIDAEAVRLYAADEAASRGLLAPPPSAPPRPTRAAIEDRQGTESGVAFDLQDEDEAVVIEGRQQDKPKREKREKAKATPAEQQKAVDTGRQMDADEAIPEDDAAWASWSADVEKKIAAAESADAVNAIASAEAQRLEAASEARRNWIRGAISERLTDFAVDGQGAN